MVSDQILKEYYTLCMSRGELKSGLEFEEEDFWRLQIGSVAFGLSNGTSSKYALKRLVYSLYRLRQLHAYYRVEDLEASLKDYTKKFGKGRRGSIYTFGKNDFQLGFGSDVAVQPIPRRVQSCERVNFVAVSAARFHTMAVTAQGKLYTWGKGQSGRLGHKNEKTYILPTRVELKLKVKVIAAGRQHSLAIVENGAVFGWGSNKYGQLGLGNVLSVLEPKDIGVNRRKGVSPVCSICTSKTHSISVREDGNVYCWGKNDLNQIGFRAVAQDSTQNSPFKLSSEAFRGLFPIESSCSEGISLILTSNGKVFQWGQGSPRPTRVAFVRRNARSECSGGWQEKEETTNSITLVSISAGPFHCAAVSERGEIFTWGSEANLLGYACVGGERGKSHVTSGQRIEKLFRRGVEIVKVQCAKRHSVALDKNGYVWVWGHGDHGVLGLTEKQTYQPEPKRIPSLSSVTDISAAERHTTVVLQEILYNQEQNHLMLDNENSNDSLEKSALDSAAFGSLQHLCQTQLLQDADVWNILSFLRFAVRYGLQQIIQYCNSVILMNFVSLIIQQRSFLKKLCEVFDFDDLLKKDIEGEYEPVTPQNNYACSNLQGRHRYSVESLGSVVSSAAVSRDLHSVYSENVNQLKSVSQKKSKPAKIVQNRFRCEICNISVQSKQVLAEHLSGRKHRKAAGNIKPKRIQVANPPTPQYTPRKKNISLCTSKENAIPAFSLGGTDFPYPSTVETPSKSHQVRARQYDSLNTESSSRYLTKRGYSLSDFLDKQKKPMLKPANVWQCNLKNKDTCSNLNNIMNEQSQNTKEVTLKQSSWGYNQVSSKSLVEIQHQQEHEKMIAQQRKLLKIFKQKQIKKKRQEKRRKGERERK